MRALRLIEIGIARPEVRRDMEVFNPS